MFIEISKKINKKMMRIKNIKHIIMRDYLMKDRIGEYEKLIRYFLKRGYQFLTVLNFCEYIKNKNKGEIKKIVILRHDIDTDIKTAYEMFKVEKKYGIKSTFYFRLTTINIDFIKKLYVYGSEVGYHFEEIASFAKNKHIKDPDKIKKYYPEIGEIFIQNLKNFEDKIGFKCKSVASHGDFINRYLKITNKELLTKDIIKRTNIICEAYDILPCLDCYISDCGSPYPKFWNISPYGIKDGVICILTHPRNWRVNFIENTKDNIKRLIDGIKYKYL